MVKNTTPSSLAKLTIICVYLRASAVKKIQSIAWQQTKSASLI